MNKKAGWFTLLVLALIGVFAVVNVYGDKPEKEKPNRTTITGQVTDPAGMPIEGVTVSIRKGRKLNTATTDAGGIYTLTKVKKKKRIVVNFEKEGYAPTQGIANTKLKKPKNKDKDKSKNKDKSKQVTLTKVLIPAGAVQQVNAEAGGTVMQDGFMVTIPPGALDASGDVDVVVSPIDVSTDQILAFPGDFTGVSSDGESVLMETFSLMNIDVRQNGESVDLREGVTANLEFLLPEVNSLAVGETVPLWFFDVRSGIWREQGFGTVGISTFDPQRFAVFGAISFRWNWWNVDKPIDTQHCVEGIVKDVDGNNVSGAEVIARGINYYGQSSTRTSDGTFCLDVRGNSQVSVTVKLTDDTSGAIQTQIVDTVDIPATQLTCDSDTPANPCVKVPPGDASIDLAGISCIKGFVRDNIGELIVDRQVLITSTAGGNTMSNMADGSYCIPTPASDNVAVYGPLDEGFNPVTVMTPPATEPCTNPTECADQDIIQGEITTGCLRGTVVDTSEPPVPVPGATVEVFFPDETSVSTTTNGDGNFCLSDLPAEIDVGISVSAEGCFGGGSAVTGPARNACSGPFTECSITQITCFFGD